MTTHSSKSRDIDLFAIAHETMIKEGFSPELDSAAENELASIAASSAPVDSATRDMSGMLWSSIDDGKSRDLDQVELVESLPNGDTCLKVGIADVDAFVARDSAIDRKAADNCTSVYTGVKTFSMLPDKLSTNLTSLVAGENRRAVVTEMTLGADGSTKSTNVYRALLKNQAKLSYEAVGAWLDGKSEVPPAVKAVPHLEEQIRLQSETAKRLSAFRKQHGALELGTIQAVPVISENGRIVQLNLIEPNSARDLISNFMVTANVAMAQFLEDKGGPSLRRVVRTPEHWDRIVDIAKELGERLPSQPDSKALADFLARRKTADLDHFPDLSLAVVKALGPGEYTVQGRGQESEGHFGLAVTDYTHSTAPNRRFADLVTQRLVKAALIGKPSPYGEDELARIAERCTERENAARKVERKIRKVAAALLMRDRIGDTFKAIVTGVSDKGVFARTISPPADGRVVKGEGNLRVGDKVDVRLLSTDPQRAFIDFARIPVTRGTG